MLLYMYISDHYVNPARNFYRIYVCGHFFSEFFRYLKCTIGVKLWCCIDCRVNVLG